MIRLPARPFLAALAALVVFAALRGDAQTVNEQKASMGEVVEAAMQPLEADPEVRYTASAANTTPIDVIASDPLTADATRQTRRYSQEIVIENFSASASVCACSTTHATLCSAATSCACKSTAPNIVPPGKSKRLRYAGTRKVCTVATASGAEYQAERTIPRVGAR